jgi:hypothetical protein
VAASLEAREAARVASIETGAPSKHEIARRVKEKLKPAWNARTLSREQFKERAERATKAASAVRRDCFPYAPVRASIVVSFSRRPLLSRAVNLTFRHVGTISTNHTHS